MTDGAWVKTAAALALCLMSGFSIGAHAEQLLVTTPLVEGSLASDTAFAVTGPGTVTVSLADLGWPNSLQSLTFAATTPTSVLATMSGVGQVSFKVTSAGVYDAIVGAVSNRAALLGLGWYSLRIDFTPAAPVPLPPDAWLLLSALVLLAAVLRRSLARPAFAAALTTT
jgi:hypothetical protein